MAKSIIWFIVILGIVFILIGTNIMRSGQNSISFILPQSAVFDNNAPQERPQQYRQIPSERTQYNRYSSTKQERRQNKMYQSQTDTQYSPQQYRYYYYNY